MNVQIHQRNLIAILRGVKPCEVLQITERLIFEGITMIEVPLNSPDAYRSIEVLVNEFTNDALIGAGTVVDIDEVDTLSEIGAKLIVSPNCQSEVIRQAKAHGMLSYPGVMTPTECFKALECGADGLKLFPSSVLGFGGVRAVNAVLPQGTSLFAVGGVDHGNLTDWMEAGITGFGIGSSLYKPGISSSEVALTAQKLVSAYDRCIEGFEE